MILVILQARMSSSRLPGKVLKPILNQPMLAHQLNRVAQAKSVTQVVVATSEEASDDPISQLCEQLEQPCFRGDLNNVLNRFIQCANQYRPEHVVRLTGDCPLIDPEVIDLVIQTHLDGQYDYTSNAYPYSYPDGLDVEVISMSALEKVAKNANQPEQLEHVTLYVRQHREAFSIGEVVSEIDHSNQRWTVDYPEDFVLVEQIFNELYPKDPGFNSRQVITLLSQRPDIFSINRMHVVNT